MDGVAVGTISVQPTSGGQANWTKWDHATTASVSVPAQYLGVGNHSVTLRRASGGGSGINVDWLKATT